MLVLIHYENIDAERTSELEGYYFVDKVKTLIEAEQKLKSMMGKIQIKGSVEIKNLDDVKNQIGVL